jgi:hypothetical protein
MPRQFSSSRAPFGSLLLYWTFINILVISLQLCFLSGVFDGISVVIRQTILQLRLTITCVVAFRPVNSVFCEVRRWSWALLKKWLNSEIDGTVMQLFLVEL